LLTMREAMVPLSDEVLEWGVILELSSKLILVAVFSKFAQVAVDVLMLQG
jgi:hypothetical protein